MDEITFNKAKDIMDRIEDKTLSLNIIERLMGSSNVVISISGMPNKKQMRISHDVYDNVLANDILEKEYSKKLEEIHSLKSLFNSIEFKSLTHPDQTE